LFLFVFLKRNVENLFQSVLILAEFR